MKLRIIKQKDGWHVEKAVKKWYGGIKWKPFITWLGLGEVYPFKTYKDAEESMIRKVKWNTWKESVSVSQINADALREEFLKLTPNPQQNEQQETE